MRAKKVSPKELWAVGVGDGVEIWAGKPKPKWEESVNSFGSFFMVDGRGVKFLLFFDSKTFRELTGARLRTGQMQRVATLKVLGEVVTAPRKPKKPKKPLVNDNYPLY